MKNPTVTDYAWHQTDYREVWTLLGLKKEAEKHNVPIDARIYTHTDTDVEPYVTQYIFDWS